jgi:hypothetical protein
MTNAELKAIKAEIQTHKEKATDLDVIVGQIMQLPYGQLKKVLTDEVLAVLAKYGYAE